MKPPILPMLLLLAALPAAAEEGKSRTIPFDEARVVTVGGRIGYQSTIEFAPGEHIENVAVGDSAAWQVTPNRRADLLFVKATSEGRSNMTVVTDRHTYMFDLVAGKGTAVTYVLRFCYPEPAAAVEAKVLPDPVARKVSAVGREAPSPGPESPWTGQGAAQLLPRRSFDDGHEVYLAWDKGVDLPAILVPGPDDSEGPVNYAVKAGYVVIDGLPPRIVLRRGEAVATLTRAGGY